VPSSCVLRPIHRVGRLQRRLREYFHQTVHLRASAKTMRLMENMSPALAAEVSWRVHRKWLDRIWFLRGAPFAFLLRLSKRIRPLVLAPSEPAPPGQLYIINRGLALHGGRVLGAGKVWGEDTCILSSAALHSIFVARAMTFGARPTDRARDLSLRAAARTDRART
jgi:hypothetical protein